MIRLWHRDLSLRKESIKLHFSLLPVFAITELQPIGLKCTAIHSLFAHLNHFRAELLSVKIEHCSGCVAQSQNYRVVVAALLLPNAQGV